MLVSRDTSETVLLSRGGLTVELLPTGDVRKIEADGVLYNMFVADALSGAVGAVYLRRYEGNRIVEAVRLNGYRSPSKFAADSRGAIYTGVCGDAAYVMRLDVTADSWFYRVDVTGKGKFDLLYTLDVGVGDVAFVRRNELYASQYLGHTVLSTRYGYAVASRQNLSQRGRNPALLQGAIGLPVERFCTDGLQFFGSRFRLTDIPACLYGDLPACVMQYEMGFVGLQTAAFTLSDRLSCGFFGHIRPDVSHKITEPFDYDRILSDYAAAAFAAPTPHDPPRSEFGRLLVCRDAVDDDFPQPVILPERDEKGLLSTFTSDYAHVVARHKEGLVERPHGNILLADFDLDRLPFDVMTTTGFMYGLFQAQTACGNTDFDAFLSLPRGFINLPRSSGLRITVETEGRRRLLGVPTLFVAGLADTRWVYALDDDVLTVTVSVAYAQTVTRVASLSGKTYDWTVSLGLALGGDNAPIDCTHTDGRLCFAPHPDTVTATYRPELRYTVALDAPHTVSDDRVFFDDGRPRDGTVTLQTSAASFCITIAADIKAERPIPSVYDTLLSSLRFDGPNADLTNTTLRWMTHDALVHYAAPHGLEQTGGAAWGTRDVCQGPVELFSALGRFDTVRKILCRVFAAQNGNGTFPQWFMFDRYPFAAGECHGDIVFWPLFALGRYLAATDDRALLSETFPDGDTLAEKAERALSFIASRVSKDGFLPYDGGDWNDTLQPIDPASRDSMTSSWTVALGMETLESLAPYFPVQPALRRLRRGFERLCKDGVVAGFGRKDGRKLTLLFHPDDAETGIHYRLISLTRSILAEADPAQAQTALRIIAAHLACPDGVRLSDVPIAYDGGVPKRFVRAEAAACVGREVGLMYTHAHLRYVQALLAVGDADAAAEALLRVNPIVVTETVPNAAPRQRNAYFSSSDAAFPTRTDFDFSAVRAGKVPVRGGWRVYSSGAGITVALLLRLDRIRRGKT